MNQKKLSMKSTSVYQVKSELCYKRVVKGRLQKLRLDVPKKTACEQSVWTQTYPLQRPAETRPILRRHGSWRQMLYWQQPHADL